MELNGKHETQNSKQNCYEASFQVPFKTEKEATVAYNSLRIDQEPSRGGVYKELNVKDNHLLVKMSSNDVRKLRSASSSFFDFLILVVNTIAQYG